MDIQVFIFNYNHFNQAINLFNRFTEYADTYIINCHSNSDPSFESTAKILKFDNIYYSGQWNEMLKLLTADISLIINSDVGVYNVKKLINRMKYCYSKYKIGLYAPNHYWTPWTYDIDLLKNVEYGLKQVPATDSTIWSLKADIAHKVGPLDLTINKLGWGIEILAAYYCKLQDLLVVRDYCVKCSHPQSTAYNRDDAKKEFIKWIKSKNIEKEFKEYYNLRNKFGFGTLKDDDFYTKNIKLI